MQNAERGNGRTKGTAALLWFSSEERRLFRSIVLKFLQDLSAADHHQEAEQGAGVDESQHLAEYGHVQHVREGIQQDIHTQARAADFSFMDMGNTSWKLGDIHIIS